MGAFQRPLLDEMLFTQPGAFAQVSNELEGVVLKPERTIR